jgi:hypothetical protein
VISWIVIVTMLVLASVRLPVIYGLLFVLIDASLVLNLLTRPVRRARDLGPRPAGRSVLARSGRPVQPGQQTPHREVR